MQLIFTLRKWNMKQRNALYFYCSYACTLVSCKPIPLSDIRHEMGTAINEVRKQTAVLTPPIPPVRIVPPAGCGCPHLCSMDGLEIIAHNV